jgi:hypothetical protein
MEGNSFPHGVSPTAADLRLSDVRYTPASPRDAARGLLGYVSLTVDGLLRLDGIALRRCLSGEIALSFPTRIDRAGKKHAYIRPVDDAARRAFEAQVFAALRLGTELAA